VVLLTRLAKTPEVSSEAPMEDIASFQVDWNLPRDVLEEVVRQATGSGVARDQRILDGHSCEVHGVTTREGRSVIVRVARRPGPVFERELWPIAAARRLGLPVPEMLLIEHTSLEGQPVSFNVQERLEGRILHRLRPELSEEELSRLTREAGRFLAAIHSIPVPGPGPIGRTGQVDPTLATDRDDITEGLTDRSAYLVDHGIDAALVGLAEHFVLSQVELLGRAPIRLVHGDWSLANLLSDGRSITGIVDWEGARADDPACDRTQWDQWHDHGPTAAEVLMAGYLEAGGSPDPELEQRRRVRRVANLHHAAVHFIATDRPDLLNPVLEHLRDTLQGHGLQ